MPNYNWPGIGSGGGSSSNASVGTNGVTAPTSSTEIAGVNPSGNLQPVSTDSSGNINVNSVSSALPTGASTSALQTSGNTTLSTISTTLGSILLDLTNGTQITQITGTVPLATGASTSALQTTGNTSLSSIDGKTPALGQALAAASIPVVLTSAQITTLTPLSTVTANQGTGQSSSPWGINLSQVGSISFGLGQQTATSCIPVVLPAAQLSTLTPLSTVSVNGIINKTGSGSAAAATVSTVTTLTAPSNAVGFVLMNLDTSTTNMRWAVGRTASTTLGQQLQPGRDTGFFPIGANVSIIAESGTCNYDIQWVAQ